MAGDPFFIVIGICITQLVVIIIDLAAVETAAGKSAEHVFGILVCRADHAYLIAVRFHAITFQSNDIVNLFTADVIVVKIAYRHIAYPAVRDFDSIHADIRMIEILRSVSHRNA